MRAFAWIGIGWFAVTLVSALAARVGLAHVQPDMAVIIAVFLALRREIIIVALTTLALGYLVGRQGLAPSGLHEIALTTIALGVYLAAGNLAGGGGLFFGFTCAVAVAAYDALLFALIYWQRGHAGFSSWATASLLPTALATGVIAVLCHPFMLYLERRLTQDKREGLAWH